MAENANIRTTTVLLESLKDERNADAWEQLDQRYRPVLTGFVRGLGLSEQELHDGLREVYYRKR
mgnify:CR=1 FL=1